MFVSLLCVVGEYHSPGGIDTGIMLMCREDDDYYWFLNASIEDHERRQAAEAHLSARVYPSLS